MDDIKDALDEIEDLDCQIEELRARVKVLKEKRAELYEKVMFMKDSIPNKKLTEFMKEPEVGTEVKGK